MDDILTRLTEAIEHPEIAFALPGWAKKAETLFADAKAEITNLRAVAGSVSHGASLAQIREQVRKERDLPEGTKFHDQDPLTVHGIQPAGPMDLTAPIPEGDPNVAG